MRQQQQQQQQRGQQPQGLSQAQRAMAVNRNWRGIAAEPGADGRFHARVVNGSKVCMLCNQVPSQARPCTGTEGMAWQLCHDTTPPTEMRLINTRR